MCAREQLGQNLRMAVRELICDGNFDGATAPRHRLEFEILVTSNKGEALRQAFLIERKSYSDLFTSQSCGAGQASRLDSQLTRLRVSVEYMGRLLIVEACSTIGGS